MLTRISNSLVPEDFLSLRREVLFDELKWLKHNPQLSTDVMDEFDVDSEIFAVYAQDTLAASGRLIARESIDLLPSGACYCGTLEVDGPVCEISKCMVSRQFRGRGLFRALILHSEIRACELGLVHVVIGIIDTPLGRSFLTREKFQLLGQPFPFEDSLVSPPEQVVLFGRSVHDCLMDLDRLTSERNGILERFDDLGAIDP